jgi:hypothetical protein
MSFTPRLATVTCLIMVAACAVPDIGLSVDEAAALLAETNNSVRPVLDPIMAQELATSEEVTMRRGGTILGLEGTCHYDDARKAGLAVTDCALVEYVRPDKGPVNATSVGDALDAMSGYFAGLAAIASSESSDEVAARAGALIEAVAAFGAEGNPASLRRLGAAAAERRDLATRGAGFLAVQYRVAAVRKVVRRADPVFDRIVPIAAAYLDTLPGGLPAAQARLEEAEEELAIAPNVSVAAHRTAAIELRAAFAAYKQAEAASPATRLYLLRRLHAGLLQSLSGPRSPEELLTVLEEIKVINDLAREGKGDGN